MNDPRRRPLFRLLRIVLIALLLMLGMLIMHPERYLPAGMTLGDFFRGLFGAILLALVLAAVGARAWYDYQKKRRNKS
jgi:hypothetical protein